MKNVMFRDAPIPRLNRNAFDLSNEVKMSCQIGHLVPFKFYEAVPGDKFQIRTDMFVKFAPLLAPIFHRVDAYVHWFKVPMRLLMPSIGTTNSPWKAFITGDPEGEYTNDILPYVTINNTTKSSFINGSVASYLGLPVIDPSTTVTQDVDINVLPFLAYHMIYNDYFRDENLIDAVIGPTASWSVPLHGGDHTTTYSNTCPIAPYRRSYEKDYFKGALPTAYKGSSDDVELDLDITGDGNSIGFYLSQTTGGAPAAGDPTFAGADKRLKDSGSTNLTWNSGSTMPGVATLEATELRRMMALQRFFEAKNRGGHRYNEYVLGVFGVIGQNAELDYPEYLGGGKQAIQVSPVINQSASLDPTAGVNDGVGGVPVTLEPQAYETGRAIGSGNSNYINTYCSEHSIIMGIFSVLPRTAYGAAQIERFWRKADYTDFFVPQLQNIGDQEILQSEIGYDATGTDMDDVFGYAPRWAEYKFSYDKICGDFIDDIDFWHMGEIGDTSGAGPDLNQVYIECDPSEDQNTRVFSDITTHKLYVQLWNDVKAIRPMHVHDIPQ